MNTAMAHGIKMTLAPRPVPGSKHSAYSVSGLSIKQTNKEINTMYKFYGIIN
jgi:hypothetical protein